MLTIPRRRLTKRGVKPITPYQHKFDNFYLFGAFSPINGDYFLLEMPFCNTDTFQVYLQELSSQKPKEFKVIILDNGAFHHSKALMIPENISLLFLPPYSPELNPAERMWRYIKDRLAMKAFKNLEEIKGSISEIVKNDITNERVKSICKSELYYQNYQSIFNV